MDAYAVTKIRQLEEKIDSLQEQITELARLIRTLDHRTIGSVRIGPA